MPQDQIVMEVCKNASYSINKQTVPKEQLASKLKEIYDPRPDKIIFVKGCPEAKYQEVITAMDAARGAGVKVIGVPPKDTK
jgi:biopolymer transport protein ExbD